MPYHAGDDRHGASQGPSRLLEAGAASRLESRGHRVTVERVERCGPFRDTATSSREVNERVARRVRHAVEGGRLALVLTGSCVTCHGVLAGLGHSRCGAVWIDAHADFNTPETTASGFFPGMSLAVATGHCYRDYRARIGSGAPLEERNVVLYGVRALSPARERARLESSAVVTVPWRDGAPVGDVIAPLDGLAARVDEVYLHVDLDAFAPDVAPGVADEPVAGGLSPGAAERIIRATGRRFRLRAATLATYTPAKDRDDRTLHLALRLVDLVAEAAGPRLARAT